MQPAVCTCGASVYSTTFSNIWSLPTDTMPLISVLSNKDNNLCVCRLLLLSVVRPSVEYGSAVWDCNKSQASVLEAIILDTGGAKKILGCSSKTCNEAVRGDMALDLLSSRRDSETKMVA